MNGSDCDFLLSRNKGIGWLAEDNFDTPTKISNYV